jgi:peptidoglycan/LPS O-acetylase OafA/YrhL
LFHLHGDLRLRSHELRRFYLQRFARIAPLFYLVLAVDLVLQRPAAPLTWHTLLENLTFTFALDHPNYALVIGGWSIGLEMLFYASFPLLALAFRSSIALAIATLASIALAWSHGAHVVEPAADAARFNAYVAIQNHAFAFLLGGWIAKLARLARARLRLPVACALLASGIAAWIARGPIVIDHFDVVLGAQRAAYVAAAMACVVLAVCTEVSSARVRAWLEGFGELSYPVYLLHPVIWVLCSEWLPARTPPALALAVALVCTGAVSLVAARLYERPLRRLLTARAVRKEGSGTPPTFAVDSAPHGPVFRS